MPTETRGRWPLIVGLALGLPFGGAYLLHHEIENRVEPRLTELVGSNVSLGWMDVTPGLGLRLSDVHIGDVLTLSSAIAYPDLSGQGPNRIEELRLDQPRWRIKPRGAETKPAEVSRPRSWKKWAPARLVVEDAELVVDLEGAGELVAKKIAIAPVPGGIRVISPDLVARATAGSVRVSGTFGRFAADLTWPTLAVQRAVAARGSLSIVSAGNPITIEQAIVSHSTAGGHKLHLSGAIGHGTVRADVDAKNQLQIALDAVPLDAFGGFLPHWMSSKLASGSGQVAVDLNAQTVRATGHVSDLLLSHRVLATEPVPLAIGLDLDASWKSAADVLKVSLASLHFQFRGVSGQLTGAIDWRPSRRDFDSLDVKLDLGKVDCARLLLAVPDPFKRHLAGMEVQGQLAAALHLAYQRENPDATRLDFDITPNACQVLAEPLEADARCALPSERRPNGCWELSPHSAPYIPLGQLKPAISRAFVLAEDGNFFAHKGFDSDQIARSFAENLGQRRLVRGGSTISQQVTKNLFLSHERTLARKLEEVILTWRLEQYLTKDEILEQYLNLVQLSDTAFGIQAGAKEWFGKHASELTPAEAAFLAALLPAPTTYAQKIRQDAGIDMALRARIDGILHRLFQNGSLNNDEYRQALAQELKPLAAR